MSIFELKKNPNYLSLSLRNEADYSYILDNVNVGKVAKFPEKPILVEYGINEYEKDNPRSTDDYPCLSGVIPVFNKKFAECFREVLEENGQIIPIVGEDQTFYMYNCTNLEDLMDNEQSDLDYCDGFLVDIKKLVLKNIPCSSTIFKLSEDPRGPMYVLDTFKTEIEEKGFKGFEFIQIT